MLFRILFLEDWCAGGRMTELSETQKKELEKLINKGKEILEGPKVYIHHTGIKEADDLYYDIEKNGHLFVLGCVMDMQIKAERAWKIPYLIMKDLGSFEFKKLLSLTQENKRKNKEDKIMRKIERDKTHIESVERWAKYVRDNPDK